MKYNSYIASSAGYYHNVIKALEAKGYKRGISLRGAPFEFRKGPCESFFELSNRL